MRTRKLSFFGLGALLLTAASCSNDTIVPEPDQVLTSDQSFYLPISVNGFGNEGTRANEFGESSNYDGKGDPNYNVGSPEENRVSNVYLVFYDAAGNKVYNTLALKTNGEGGLKPGTTTDPNENALYTGVVQIDLTTGQAIPSYVLAFINPVSTTDITIQGGEFSTLEEVEKATREDLISDKLFAMSNSVYYNEEGTRIMATPIATSQIFNTKQEAQTAIETNPDDAYVNIYVERYAGKVNFSLNPDKIQELTLTQGMDDETKSYKIKFVPKAWTVNANEEISYVTKNFFAQSGEANAFDFSKPASYDQMEKTLKPWYWNSSANHRSYWGQSPNYYLARYPRVSDDITDQDNWQPKQKGDYELKYYSYNEMMENIKDDLDALARNFSANGTSKPIYARENTVSGSALRNAKANPLASPKAAIASVVMVGQYQVSEDGGDYADYNGTFYVTGTEGNYQFYNEAQMIRFFVNNVIKLAKDADGTPFFDYKNDTDIRNANFLAGNGDYAKCFEVVHPSAEVRGNLVLDSRYVTLQIKEDAEKEIYAKVGDTYQKVTTDNLVTINQQLLAMAGTAFGFNTGMAYFNIPIQHLGYYRSDNENKKVSGGANNADGFDWTIVKSGDFGIVRNHMYTIEATQISGLGNAIPNPEIPIVPPGDPEEYWIGARIVVLNWAVVPTQSVEL